MKARLAIVSCLSVVGPGCVGSEITSGGCGSTRIVAVAQADAPDVYDALRTAHDEVSVAQTHVDGLSAATLQLDVVSLGDVEFVEESGSCSSDYGHRSRALVDVHTVDGSFSAQVPGLVSRTLQDEVLQISFIDDEVEIGDSQVPDADRPQGSVVGGLDLSVEGDVVTLSRIDVASSCESFDTCASTGKTALVSWTQAPPDSDMWLQELPI